MKNDSTHCMNEVKKMKKEPNANEGPRKQTLDFLRQFARVYQVEPMLKPTFDGYVLN
mgnify:FL=1|jgi:hypothetical protein